MWGGHYNQHAVCVDGYSLECNQSLCRFSAAFKYLGWAVLSLPIGVLHEAKYRLRSICETSVLASLVSLRTKSDDKPDFFESSGMSRLVSGADLVCKNDIKCALPE